MRWKNTLISAVSWEFDDTPISDVKYCTHQWNNLLETYCMKYLYDATNQYISMEKRTLWNKKHRFLEIYFIKLIICIVWGNVAQLPTLLSCFSLIQMKRLQRIVSYIFPYYALGCKYVARNIFINHVSCNMFHRCVPRLRPNKIEKVCRFQM